MTEKIRNHVAEYNKKNSWHTDEECIIESIREANTVYVEVIEERRHWNDTFVVVEIDGLLIGYGGAKTTGDMSPDEKGWEFGPETICEVVKEEVTKTIYRRKQ